MGPGAFVFDCNLGLIIDCTVAKRHSTIKAPNTADYGVSQSHFMWLNRPATLSTVSDKEFLAAHAPLAYCKHFPIPACVRVQKCAITKIISHSYNHTHGTQTTQPTGARKKCACTLKSVQVMIWCYFTFNSISNKGFFYILSRCFTQYCMKSFFLT